MASTDNVIASCGPDNVPPIPPAPCARCGYRPRPPRPLVELVQLELSRSARLRRKLRRLVDDSNLPQGVFGEMVFGCDQTTICSYLAGKRIPNTRAGQIQRIESVEARHGSVVIILSHRHNERWDFQLYQRSRARLENLSRGL